MTSKEALERIANNFGEYEISSRYYDLELNKDIQTIKQDLEWLEKLEKNFWHIKAVLDRVLILKFKEDIISGGDIYISEVDSINTTIVNLRKPEYYLLKEVLEEWTLKNLKNI